MTKFKIILYCPQSFLMDPTLFCHWEVSTDVMTQIKDKMAHVWGVVV